MTTKLTQTFEEIIRQVSEDVQGAPYWEGKIGEENAVEFLIKAVKARDEEALNLPSLCVSGKTIKERLEETL